MDSFSNPSASGGSSPPISQEDFMNQLKSQLAQAYAEEFLEVFFLFFSQFDLIMSDFVIVYTFNDVFYKLSFVANYCSQSLVNLIEKIQ